jgi:adenosylhomocysteine nucleosidase
MGEVRRDLRVVVLISADIEWRAVRELFPHQPEHLSPPGEWFEASWEAPSLRSAGEVFLSGQVTFFHGGWGKIAAAASTQYVIDRWIPDLLVNLGTCGGFAGEIERGTVILVERTIVYDIFEQMGDAVEHLAHYDTQIDLSWLEGRIPPGVRRALLVSGDRDLFPGDIADLKARFGAIAGDWESGAIAYVAARNNTRCLILRSVTDLVGEHGGEAYGDLAFFTHAAPEVMARLVKELPAWLARLEPGWSLRSTSKA